VVGIAWRFRSWLVGVFENVEVMGMSGADLETELMPHQTNAEDTAAEDAQPPDSAAAPAEE